MKLIVKDDVIIYKFKDADKIEMLEDKIITPDFIIADLNNRNSTLVEDVNIKLDSFVGHKYIYDKGIITNNPDYVDVNLERLRELEEHVATLTTEKDILQKEKSTLFAEITTLNKINKEII